MKNYSEAQRRDIIGYKEQLNHLEKLNAKNQQQIDSTLQQLNQKQETLGQMDTKIKEFSWNTDALIKDKAKLIQELETKENIETQNQILRHLDGLMVDLSSVNKSSLALNM